MFRDQQIKMHDLVDIVINVLDARDPYTFSHSWRVARMSELIAEEMNLPVKEIERFHISAHLHDIGKIGVPDTVLNKCGRLTREEMIQMQAHSRIGYNILKRLSLLNEIADIVLYHHERYDGMGYPNGLKGQSIPLGSRIIAAADSFDAITSDRPYRKGMSFEEGFIEISRHIGDQFCPEVAEFFLKVRDKIPDELDKIERDEIDHIAFVGHEELMHSRRII